MVNSGSSSTSQQGTDGLGGGGGGAYSVSNGKRGGNGVVILRIPSKFTATFSGVSASMAEANGFKTYTCTSGNGTVTFS